MGGFYSGLGAQAARDVGGSVFYFLTYQIAIQRLMEAGYSTIGSAFAAGSLAGVMSWVTTMPMDVVKTKMQSGTCRSLRSCLRILWQEGGVLSFSRGLSFVASRALVVNGMTFFGYELAIGWLGAHQMRACVAQANCNTDEKLQTSTSSVSLSKS